MGSNPSAIRIIPSKRKALVLEKYSLSPRASSLQPTCTSHSPLQVTAKCQKVDLPCFLRGCWWVCFEWVLVLVVLFSFWVGNFAIATLTNIKGSWLQARVCNEINKSTSYKFKKSESTRSILLVLVEFQTLSVPISLTWCLVEQSNQKREKKQLSPIRHPKAIYSSSE